MCYGGCDCAKCSGEPIKPTPAKQWVQHISGQGEKWEVTDNGEKETYWQICTPKVCAVFFHLPKSEYRLCDPPKVWRDVTEACGTVPCGDDIVHCGGIIREEKGYRLRKVHLTNSLTDPGWAFIVEQKVTQ